MREANQQSGMVGKAAREPMVHRQVKELMVRLEGLSKELVDLEERLRCVLSTACQAAPCGTKECVQQPVMPPLCESLEGLVRMVDESRSRVRGMTEGLEL